MLPGGIVAGCREEVRYGGVGLRNYVVQRTLRVECVIKAVRVARMACSCNLEIIYVEGGESGSG